MPDQASIISGRHQPGKTSGVKSPVKVNFYILDVGYAYLGLSPYDKFTYFSQTESGGQWRTESCGNDRRLSFKCRFMPSAIRCHLQASRRALNVNDVTIEKVTNINEIMKFGVMMTPALAVDGVVKVVGKVPDSETIKAMLT